MAMIKCPECGKQVSDKANSCPNCGYGVKPKKKVNMKIVVIVICCLALIIFGGIAAYRTYTKQQAEKAAQLRIQKLAEAEEAEKAREAEEQAYQERILNILYDLDISDLHGYNNDKARGVLTNNSDTTVYYVEIKFTFLRNNGDVVDTASTYAVGSEGLEPGESCEFYVYNNYAYGAGYKFTAEVYDFDIQ